MNGNDFTSTSITTTTTVSNATPKSPAPPLTVQHSTNADWKDDNDPTFLPNTIKDIYNEDGFYNLESQSTPSSVVSSSCAASIINEYSNQDPNFASEDDPDLQGPRSTMRRSASSTDSQSFPKRRSRRKEPLTEQRKFNIAMAKKLSPIAKYKEQMKKVKAKRNQRRKFSLIHSFESSVSTKRREVIDRSSSLKFQCYLQPPPSPTNVHSPPTSTVSTLTPLPQPSAFYPPRPMYIVDDTATTISQFPQEVIAYQTQIASTTALYSENSTTAITPTALRNASIFVPNN